LSGVVNLQAAGLLSQARFFSALTRPQLERVAALGRMRSFPQDTRIYAIGDAVDDFYVLAEGMVRFTLGLGPVPLSALEREVLEAGRASRTVAILAVDVDHFREHDDRWGDPEGGRILQEVAATLLRVTRSEEVLCRLGGEQLLVILPEASLEVAAGRAEDLRRAALGVGEGAVTLSIGVAAYPLHGAAPSTLVRAADLALYQAKREGRNRVCIAPAPEPGPEPASEPGPGTSPED